LGGGYLDFGRDTHQVVENECRSVRVAMRPLFSYLHAVVAPTGVYAATADFRAGSSLTDRITTAASDFVRLLLACGPPGIEIKQYSIPELELIGLDGAIDAYRRIDDRTARKKPGCPVRTPSSWCTADVTTARRGARLSNTWSDSATPLSPQR